MSLSHPPTIGSKEGEHYLYQKYFYQKYRENFYTLSFIDTLTTDQEVVITLYQRNGSDRKRRLRKESLKNNPANPELNFKMVGKDI